MLLSLDTSCHRRNYDVCIIGSGPAAYATCIGLLRSGVSGGRIAILESSTSRNELARDHAATRCPHFTDGRPIDWQVLELPPALDSCRGAMRRPDEECWVRAAQQHPGNLLHSSGLAANDARHDVYPRESCDGC